jgi:hypothetical protein
LDEVTESVSEIGKNEGPEKAREFLSELRRIRETHANIRWVLTGSIGFHHVIRQIGTTEATIGDVRSFPLGPLDPDWSAWLAGSVLWGAGLADGSGQDAETRAEVARVTDGIPILIHLIGQFVLDSSIQTVSKSDVTGLLDACFQRADMTTNLTHFLSRLDDYYQDPTSAELVLDTVANQPTSQQDLLAFPNITRALLQSLESDHYLSRDIDNRMIWKYPSLCRLWMIRRGI